MTTITLDGVQRLEAELGEIPEKMNRAIVRGINRALTAGRAAMVTAMSQDLQLPARVVREAMPIREASLGRMFGQFGASLKRIALIHFGARQTRRGVTANTGRGRKVYPGTFVATMPSGHTGVYQRKTRKRLPIAEKMGPSLGIVFAKFRPMGEARALEVFDSTFDHEMAFRSTQVSDAGTD